MSGNKHTNLLTKETVHTKEKFRTGRGRENVYMYFTSLYVVYVQDGETQ